MTLEIVLRKCGGPYYRTRDGRLAAVVESNVDLTLPACYAGRSLWQGCADGAYVEWNRDGTHRDGDAALDLVAVDGTED